ncbi:MAG: ExbD/TolR family protein [Saprospiraceae bacterium]
MPKHKPKRGAPFIDMTAMTDVAFLLLTFFMLTAKMKPAEAVIVDTPSSVSETKLPDAGTLMILISPEGTVYLDMTGQHTRYNLIKSMNEQYPMGLTEEDMLQFSIVGGFGVPRANLAQWLRMEPHERNAVKVPGIPTDSTNNELGPWLHNARLEQAKLKLQGSVSEDYVIVIKADKETPYPDIQKVINTLTDVNINKFNLITNLEAAPE